MSILGRIANVFRAPSPVQAAPRPFIRARYDNATPTAQSERNFWMADYFSAKAANSFNVRRILRTRSRYEMANNPFLYGICRDNAKDLISTGATLQVTTKDKAFNKRVEEAFGEWAREVGLVEKIRTCKLAKTVDGEGFLILKTVEDLENSVKLYPVDVEADQVTTPSPYNIAELWVDGLVLHPVTGQPIAYTVLKHHPGDFFFPDLNPLKYEKIRTKYVIHWFDKFRPGQVRGIPVFTSSLDEFQDLRSYRKSVLGAAEIAADYAALVTSKAPANTLNDFPSGTGTPADDDGDRVFDKVPIDRKMLTFLPDNVDIKQMDPKQPTTTYDGFQQACLGEACRPLSYPLNLALGSSQKFNFSSSKLDHTNYRESLKVERRQCEEIVLEPIFRQWVEEAIMVPGLLPKGINSIADIPHEWHWPPFASLDPKVDADTDHARLTNGTKTYRQFWAEQGEDYLEIFEQQENEKDLLEKAGIQFGEPAKKTIRDDETGDMNPDEAPPEKEAANV